MALPADQPAIHVDLDGDTDHTGLVEHSLREEEREDRDGEQGLIVLPNWDDDDPPGSPGHGAPDCLIENRFAQVAFPNLADRFDNVVNGDADRDEDMQLLAIRRIPNLPVGWRVVLRVPPEHAGKIRVFDEADRAVLIPRNAAPFVAHKREEPYYEHEVANIRGPDEEFLQYHVEGILPGARFRIELVALEGTEERSKDVIRGRVAPFLLASNERPVRQAVVPDLRGVPPRFRLVVLPGLAPEEDAVRQATERLARITTAPPTDPFWQDGFQSGYAMAPGPGHVRTMILLARFPKEATNFVHPASQPPIPAAIAQKSRDTHWLWPNRASDFLVAAGERAPPALLGPGVGVFEMPELPALAGQSPVNHGGNLEVSWPLADAAFGRLVVGKQMDPIYREFLRLQDLQAPPVELDLGFLLVKHVDEVAYFLPDKRVAIPSPELGRKLLAGFYRTHPDPATAVFLKGREVLRGRLTGVRAEGGDWILADGVADLRPVRPGTYLHIYRGPGRSQTYDVVRTGGATITVQREAATYFSYWRSEPVEAPAPGSEYIVVEQPLHDLHARVLLTTISELVDLTNPKVREFWRQNDSAGRAIRDRVRPELEKLAPVQIVELPVLFHEAQSSGVTGATAFTPNLANGQLFGSIFLMPKPFVLRLPSGVDLFEEATSRMLASLGLEAQFVDSYFLFHNLFGEVHCAVNAILEPDPSRVWWEYRR